MIYSYWLAVRYIVSWSTMNLHQLMITVHWTNNKLKPQYRNGYFAIKLKNIHQILNSYTVCFGFGQVKSVQEDGSRHWENNSDNKIKAIGSVTFAILRQDYAMSLGLFPLSLQWKYVSKTYYSQARFLQGAPVSSKLN